MKKLLAAVCIWKKRKDDYRINQHEYRATKGTNIILKIAMKNENAYEYEIKL